MTLVVCTIFEGDYHLGLAALVNSLYKSGFRGDVFAAYRGNLPNWARSMEEEKLRVAENLHITFRKVDHDGHLTNFKPSWMLKVFELNSDVSGLFYFDPDIVVTAPWPFFCEWITYGVALCSDVTRYMMHPTHPIKQMWKANLSPLFASWRDCSGYANAGFVGIHRDCMPLLKTWKEIIGINKEIGINQELLSLKDPWQPFYAQDQDALNAAIHLSNVPISLAGQEEMGFFASTPYMAHALGPNKPWRRRFIREARRGQKPAFAARQYWHYVEEPIRIYSPLRVRVVQLEILLAKIIASLRG